MKNPTIIDNVITAVVTYTDGSIKTATGFEFYIHCGPDSSAYALMVVDDDTSPDSRIPIITAKKITFHAPLCNMFVRGIDNYTQYGNQCHNVTLEFPPLFFDEHQHVTIVIGENEKYWIKGTQLVIEMGVH